MHINDSPSCQLSTTLICVSWWNTSLSYHCPHTPRLYPIHSHSPTGARNAFGHNVKFHMVELPGSAIIGPHAWQDGGGRGLGRDKEQLWDWLVKVLETGGRAAPCQTGDGQHRSKTEQNKHWESFYRWNAAWKPQKLRLERTNSL